MGIRGYGSWLRSVFPTAFSRVSSPIAFDEAYVDLNPILHFACRISRTEKQVLSHSKRVLISLLLQYLPRRMTLLAMDGVAPLSKLALQRSRRIENSRTAIKEGKFDAQNITPGCLFMSRAERDFENLLQNFTLNHPGLATDFFSILSGASTSGEGEVKIISELCRRSVKHPNLTRAVISTDSDLMLQSVVLQQPSVYVLDPFSTENRSSVWTCFSPSILRSKLIEQSGVGVVNRLVLDFALLSLFCGNDYLPSLRFTSINSLWISYIRARQEGVFKGDEFLVNDQNLNLSGLKEFAAFFCANSLPDNVRSFMKNGQDPVDSEATHNRLIHHLNDVLISIDALLTGNSDGRTFETRSMSRLPSAPTIADLATMDIALVEKSVKLIRSHPGVQLHRQPISSALLTLDPNSEYSSMLPRPIVSIMQQLRGNGDSIESSNAALVSRISELLRQIPLNAFTAEERAAVFERDPIKLFRSPSPARESNNVEIHSPSKTWIKPCVSHFSEAAINSPVHRHFFPTQK